MTTAISTKITHDDLLKMPEDNLPREIIDGELIVSPTPSAFHQRVVLELATFIRNFLRVNPIGEVFISPLDTILAPSQVLQPDLLFISRERAPIVQRWVYGAPDLAVEVISETSRRRDEVRKRQLYEQFGVIEYWIVDRDARSVKIYRRGASGGYEHPLLITAAEDKTLTTPLLPGLTIDLVEVFAE
jgi:Uma2 family endonuclease